MSSNNNNSFEKINAHLTEVRKSLAAVNAKVLDEHSLQTHHNKFMKYYDEGLALLDTIAIKSKKPGPKN
ncbi:hypothetical protein [Piscirickettsia salmonis]|uniref:hypothetical protein n=1 Tax=Piscirickettsia salmonis TaxID=1238 RepID=UPI0012BAB788|nr:hypothetical protein [Piscirickettsia salmonis]QGP40366.1 hypothetical protein Psal182_02545 [Piscirickettsia salmonis]